MFRAAIIASLFALTSTSQCNREAPRDPLAWERHPHGCYHGPDTFSNRLDPCEVVVLVRLSSVANDEREPASQEFVVSQVARGEGAAVAKGDRIVLPGKRPFQSNELFLLAGDLEGNDPKTNIHWYYLVKVTPACFDYVATMPGSDRLTDERRLHFVAHLESPDPQVQEDAFLEVEDLFYPDLRSLAKQFPAAKLRKFLADPNTDPRRVARYALLLGLCGNEQDVDLLARVVGEPSSEFRPRLEDAMVGYLLLSGEKGLEFLERSRINGQDVTFAEKYGVFQAVRIFYQFEPARIRIERLRELVRPLLDDPELADLAIYDLARMRDWSVQDRLMEMYGQERFNVPGIKRAIVRYMLRSADDAQQREPNADTKHVEQARANLATLREKDPKTMREAEKYFLPAKTGK